MQIIHLFGKMFRFESDYRWPYGICVTPMRSVGVGGFGSLLAVCKRVMRVWSNAGCIQGSENHSHNRMQHVTEREETTNLLVTASARALERPRGRGEKVMKHTS